MHLIPHGHDIIILPHPHSITRLWYHTDIVTCTCYHMDWVLDMVLDPFLLWLRIQKHSLLGRAVSPHWHYHTASQIIVSGYGTTVTWYHCCVCTFHTWGVCSICTPALPPCESDHCFTPTPPSYHLPYAHSLIQTSAQPDIWDVR